MKRLTQTIFLPAISLLIVGLVLSACSNNAPVPTLLPSYTPVPIDTQAVQLAPAVALVPSSTPDPSPTLAPVYTFTPSPTDAPTSTPTPAATLSAADAYQATIQAGLKIVSDVQQIDVSDNRAAANGKRTIKVAYQTGASTANERITEWFAILDPLADTITTQGLDVDEVDLTGSDASGGLAGRFSTTSKDLLAYSVKQLTRAQFLYRAKYVSLLPTPTKTPTLSKDQRQQTAVMRTMTKVALNDAKTATAYIVAPTLTERAYDRQQTATWAALNAEGTRIMQTIEAPIVYPTISIPNISVPSGGGSSGGGGGIICADGTISNAVHRQGACSHHGGIAN